MITLKGKIALNCHLERSGNQLMRISKNPIARNENTPGLFRYAMKSVSVSSVAFIRREGVGWVDERSANVESAHCVTPGCQPIARSGGPITKRAHRVHVDSSLGGTDACSRNANAQRRVGLLPLGKIDARPASPDTTGASTACRPGIRLPRCLRQPPRTFLEKAIDFSESYLSSSNADILKLESCQ